MLWFLARTGSPLPPIGPRSLLAFWLGGAASTASVTPPVQAGGSGSSLEFPFKTRPLPPIDKLIEEFALPPTKPSRSTARLLAQAATDYRMALLLLLSD